MRPRPTTLALLCALALLPLLACGTRGVVTGASARWACPSPEPLPYGAAGPVRELLQVPIGTATPTGDMVYRDEPQYYAIWEREYGALASGPPYPSPTPYARVGAHFALGQRVEVGPLHVTVSARAGAPVGPGEQLYLITIEWRSRSDAPLPISYGEHVRLRAISAPGGAVVSDARWGVSARALALAGLDAPPAQIPPGLSSVTLPVLAPPGAPETVEIAFVGAASLGATPEVGATPTPNDALRAGDDPPLLVQWSDAAWAPAGAPPCGDPGALTAWAAGPLQVWGVDAPAAGVAAPPGAERVVQIALNQVGKRYVWGAKGPETFDCSGLVSWSYAQIGLRIPAGTAGQWPTLAPRAAAELQPGDLVYFDMDADGRIDHVGMLVGDLNGNGQWDMVHAASPALGVRVELDLLSAPAYRSRVAGFRSARG